MKNNDEKLLKSIIRISKSNERKELLFKAKKKIKLSNQLSKISKKESDLLKKKRKLEYELEKLENFS